MSIRRSTARIEFQGTVQFNLGEVSHPSFGILRNIEGSFPRIKPRHERMKLANPEDLDNLTNSLMGWIDTHFETKGKEEYFRDLAFTVCLFAVYVHPTAQIYSREMSLFIKGCFWCWYHDDELEEAIEASESPIPFDLLKKGTDFEMSILDGVYEEALIQKCPKLFHPLIHALIDFNNQLSEFLGAKELSQAVIPFRNVLERYAAAMRWNAIDKIDGRYSEMSYGRWRRRTAFFDGIAELISLVHGVKIPPSVRKSFIFQRIMEIGNSFGGFVNDLLGMKKEFEDGKQDNIICFKVLEKGEPLQMAVDGICNHLVEELEDYILLKRALLQEFHYNEDLIKYLDICDSLIDGHNIIYQESERHKAKGEMTLSREN